MVSHVEGLGAPGLTTRLTTRWQARLVKFVAAVKARDDVKTSLPLMSGEPVLAMTCDSGGRWVAASDRALYHHGGVTAASRRSTEWVRVGWEEMGKLYWNDREGTLTFTGMVPTVARMTVLQLPAGANLGALARERLAWTEVVRTEIQLGEHGRARVIARRQPGSDELTWLVGLDGGKIGTPSLQAALDVALSELRARLGL